MVLPVDVAEEGGEAGQFAAQELDQPENTAMGKTMSRIVAGHAPALAGDLADGRLVSDWSHLRHCRSHHGVFSSVPMPARTLASPVELDLHHEAEATTGSAPGRPVIAGDRGNGAVYLLRTVAQTHVHLSSMADTKANILIGACALMFSLLIGRIQTDGYSLPLAVLLVSTLLAATMAILAVMPKAKGPPPGSPHFNPLFFGCFSQLDPHRFAREMEKVLATDSSIYTAMAMDIYGMGGVLYRKKYRFLSYSYAIFLAGLVLAFASLLLTERL